MSNFSPIFAGVMAFAMIWGANKVAVGADALPNDAGKPYVSIFTHDDYSQRPDEQKLVNAWQTNPELRKARESSHFRHYTESTPDYQDRMKASVPTVPAVLCTTADGQVLYYSDSQRNLLDAREWAKIVLAIVKHRPRLLPWNCPGGKCPGGQCPQKAEPVVVNVTNPPAVTPEPASPAEPAADNRLFVAMLILAITIAAVAALAVGFHRRVDAASAD